MPETTTPPTTPTAPGPTRRQAIKAAVAAATTAVTANAVPVATGTGVVTAAYGGRVLQLNHRNRDQKASLIRSDIPTLASENHLVGLTKFGELYIGFQLQDRTAVPAVIAPRGSLPTMFLNDLSQQPAKTYPATEYSTTGLFTISSPTWGRALTLDISRAPRDEFMLITGTIDFTPSNGASLSPTALINGREITGREITFHVNPLTQELSPAPTSTPDTGISI